MTPPNLLSISRMLITLPLVLLLLERQFGWALLLISIAGLTDLLDGMMARRFRWTSPLGGVLDPAADKLLITGACVSLLMLGEMPVWLFWMILGRDLAVLCAVGLLVAKRRINGSIAPKFTGKVAVAAQICLVVVTLVNLYLGKPWNLTPLFYLCGALTLVSFTHYLTVWLSVPTPS